MAVQLRTMQACMQALQKWRRLLHLKLWHVWRTKFGRSISRHVMQAEVSSQQTHRDGMRGGHMGAEEDEAKRSEKDQAALIPPHPTPPPPQNMHQEGTDSNKRDCAEKSVPDLDLPWESGTF